MFKGTTSPKLPIESDLVRTLPDFSDADFDISELTVN